MGWRKHTISLVGFLGVANRVLLGSIPQLLSIVFPEDRIEAFPLPQFPTGAVLVVGYVANELALGALPGLLPSIRSLGQ